MGNISIQMVIYLQIGGGGYGEREPYFTSHSPLLPQQIVPPCFLLSEEASQSTSNRDQKSLPFSRLLVLFPTQRGLAFCPHVCIPTVGGTRVTQGTRKPKNVLFLFIGAPEVAQATVGTDT